MCAKRDIGSSEIRNLGLTVPSHVIISMAYERLIPGMNRVSGTYTSFNGGTSV